MSRQSLLLEETGETHSLTPHHWHHFLMPSHDSNPGSGERQLADSGNAVDHTTIRAGHVGSCQGFVVGAGANQ